MHDLEQARRLLCSLGDAIREAVIAGRGRDFSAVAAVTAADTIYSVDKISENVVLNFFEDNWPGDWPLELVMEGATEAHSLTFPVGTAAGATRWKCIIDPIDGTRGLMHDKRPGWALAALAQQRGGETRLADIEVAAMTELPVTKQWRADQLSAIQAAGVVAESVDVLSGARTALALQPSSATDFRHGFATISNFFPNGKVLLAELTERLWRELYGRSSGGAPAIFEDQYICAGGQLFELASGHDRMVGDLRPLALRKLGYDESILTCHPYDVCTALVLTEAGGVFEAPDGSPVDVLLDTVTPVAWMGYANETLARQVRPVLQRLIKELFSPAATMRLHLGAVPPSPDFVPDAAWKPLREPTPWGAQLLALPIGLVLAVGVGGLWFWLTPVREVDFPVSVSESVLLFCATVILHELIHAITHPGAGRRPVSVLGFWPSRVVFYAHYAGELSRERFIAILLMPVLVLSLGPVLLAALVHAAWPVVGFVSIFNALVACGDVLGAGLVAIQVPRHATVRNQQWRTYWRQDRRPRPAVL